MKIYSVSEITSGIRSLIEENFSDVWIDGEISNFKPATSGHFYFTLKDESAQIRSVMFRGANLQMKFRPESGLSVLCYGRISVYEPRGEYQIIVEHMEPRGVGALQLAFEQLKKKLEAEGLFAPERKKEIPFLPRRIGIITSPTGAVIRDMIHILTRRFPEVSILLSPVAVQGNNAATEIAKAISEMNDRDDLDVLIVGRGGGSVEDLWAFNEEILARAIAASRIPIISAVGHETDFTIADFVADLRAPTPSAAAELAVPVMSDLVNTLESMKHRLIQATEQKIENSRLLLRRWEGYFRDPTRRLTEWLLRVDHFRNQMTSSLQHRMQTSFESLKSIQTHLQALNPRAILARGYAIATLAGESRPLLKASEAGIDQKVHLQLFEGELTLNVTMPVDSKPIPR